MALRSKGGPYSKIPGFITPKIVKLLATADLKCELDLQSISFQCRNSMYNPKKFPALRMQIREPFRTTALIFKTGKIVITGAKSEQQSLDAAKYYTRVIKEVGYQRAKLTNFKIQNIVATCSVNFKIHLEKFYQSGHYKFCDFNPETFPGLIYHLHEPKICLLIFAIGKIVLTGAKSRQNIEQAFIKVEPELRKYQKRELRPIAAMN